MIISVPKISVSLREQVQTRKPASPSELRTERNGHICESESGSHPHQSHMLTGQSITLAVLSHMDVCHAILLLDPITYSVRLTHSGLLAS